MVYLGYEDIGLASRVLTSFINILLVTGIAKNKNIQNSAGFFENKITLNIGPDLFMLIGTIAR